MLENKLSKIFSEGLSHKILAESSFKKLNLFEMVGFDRIQKIM